MRSICLAVAITLTPIAAHIATPPPIMAQSLDETADTVAKLGAWSARYNEVMVEMAALFDNPVFDKFIEDILDDNITIEESEISLKAWREDHKKRMSNINILMENMPEAPQVSGKDMIAIRDGLVEQRKSMWTAAEDLDEIAIRLDEIATKALSGDPSGLEEMTVILLERGISALINENSTLETSKNSLPDNTHPNYYLIGIMQDVNLFTVEELRILKKSNMGETGRAARIENTRSMNRILDGAEKRIRLARVSTDKYLSQLRPYTKVLSADTKEGQMINAVIAMMENFHVATDVEEEIINLQRRALSLYESDLPDEEIESKTNAFEAELYDKIDLRIKLHGERANMAASIGG